VESQVDGWEKAESDRKRADEERQLARQRYAQAVARLTAGDGSSLAGMTDLAAASGYSAKELEGMGVHALQQYANLALADDVVTQEEDNHLQSMVPALGLSWQAINNASPGLLDRVVIAEANGDLLPVLDDARVILKKGEVAHWQCPAALMKDVTQREFRAGFQGFSFPVGKTGIRYRVGGARGADRAGGLRRARSCPARSASRRGPGEGRAADPPGGRSPRERRPRSGLE